MGVNGFSAYCATCGAVATCRRMFGSFWAVKSTDGTGCANPVEREPADEARACVQPAPAPKMPRRPVRQVRMRQTDLFRK